jgi:SMODS and SLOG-associating 2TM effector domain 2
MRGAGWIVGTHRDDNFGSISFQTVSAQLMIHPFGRKVLNQQLETGHSRCIMTKIDNLTNEEFPDLEWGADHLRESLDAVYHYAVDKARQAQRWYFAKKSWKRRWGWVLRVTALVATPLAGLLPVMDSMLRDTRNLTIPPGWATVLIALAGLCVMLDRFGGFTSGWIRYVLTAQKIGRELESFRFAWDQKKSQLAGIQPGVAQARQFLDDALRFTAKISELVAEETAQWAIEFEGALREIEAAAEAVSRPQQQGGINLTVKNGSLSVGGWRLRIDEGEPQSKAGNRAGVNSLAPGLHVIHITGKIDGKTASDEQTVEVVGGTVCEIEMELAGTE